MDKQIAKLYENAPRFDEGQIFQQDEYHEMKRRQSHIYDLLVATFGEGVIALLDDYTDTLFEEMEFEARHFFQEGYRMAQGKT